MTMSLDRYRRILSRPPYFPTRVPTSSPKDGVPDPHLPPQQYERPPCCPNLVSLIPKANLTVLIYSVYANGEVCISILHAPTNDPYGYESASERWSPVQTPETILLSVISMLSSPNDESPANVEAARMWREDPKEFRRRCRANVRASLGEE